MTVDVHAIARKAIARHAHHEAGHAVAAVARGGRLEEVYLGTVDWSTADDSDDTLGGTVHRTRYEHQPFVTFAGPWATAMWMLHNDSDVEYLDDALGYAWDDADHDQVKYEARIDQLQETATQLGFSSPTCGVGRTWEAEWCDELDELWPAVQYVAALLIDGRHVDHGIVSAIIESVSSLIN